ncbi:MAG: hypothetical protein OEU54_05140 [Gemmatimonadota bacterium]|nr:hypothetical protein [Gemmatimonadota bacterium]
MKATEGAGVLLSTVLVAIGLHQGLSVLTDHLSAADFPDHARFHAALGGAYLILLSLLAGWIAWSGTLRRSCRGLLLPAVLLTLPAGFLTAIGVVPEGTPGGSYAALAAGGAVVAVLVAVLQTVSRDREPDGA